MAALKSPVEQGEHGTLDPKELKRDFPLLSEGPGSHLVYLDSAASSQKPRSVISAMDEYYETSHANVHRGVYSLAEEATARFEAARKRLGRFVGAPEPASEIVFTKNVTEALNLVARSWGGANLGPGDSVLLSEIEHHANLVPWLMLSAEKGFDLRYLRLGEDGELDLSDIERQVEGVKLVAITMCSNVLGTLVPMEPIVSAAHAAGALVVADAAQYVPHMRTDVQELGVDMLAFTGHKMLGPTGIGVLWARAELLDSMPPFMGGGEMITDVRLDGFTPNEIPWKFEAGTPPIAEAIGLAAAADYLDALGMAAVRSHDVSLTSYALKKLASDHGDKIHVHGPTDPSRRGGAISFSFADIHPHDVSQVLDTKGVCVRAGHHCAKPLMRRLGVAATTRASVYLYNDDSDIDALSSALYEAERLFG